MAETHETIDSLLAEFRGYSAFMPPSYHVTMSWHDFRVMLDRFEAAHRRERGDAAKLREALNEIRVAAMSDYEQDADCLIEKCNAALASPPRNCDRFASAEEAWNAFDEWAESYRAKGKTEPFNEVGWLFATATEKEGGTND